MRKLPTKPRASRPPSTFSATTLPRVAQPDGRRRRSEESQRLIVSAMMALITEGRIRPSAEEVAARANVGLRSVFRHFKDMETLFRAMSQSLAQGLAAFIAQPYAASDWRGQILEMIERRAILFERLTPFRRSERAHRHLSPFLQSDHATFVALQRDALLKRLPPQALADPDIVDAADVLLSFETWLRLRDDQGLSFARAKRVLTLTMTALLARCGLRLQPMTR